MCINEAIIAHLLSNTEQGIQKQLDGLKTFCNNNKMIVNETKAKVMNFGKNAVRVYTLIENELNK